MPPENRFTFSFLRSPSPSSSSKLVGQRFALLAAHAVIRGMEGENLADLQAAVQIALLRHHGDALLDVDGIARDVDAHDRSRAGRWESRW